MLRIYEYLLYSIQYFSRNSTFCQDCHGSRISIMDFVSGVRLQSYRLRQFNQDVFAKQNMRSTTSQTFFITSLSSFVDLYPLEIKNCKYKCIFNILISSMKILKFLKFHFKKGLAIQWGPLNLYILIVNFENISKTDNVLKIIFSF